MLSPKQTMRVGCPVASRCLTSARDDAPAVVEATIAISQVPKLKAMLRVISDTSRMKGRCYTGSWGVNFVRLERQGTDRLTAGSDSNQNGRKFLAVARWLDGSAAKTQLSLLILFY